MGGRYKPILVWSNDKGASGDRKNSSTNGSGQLNIHIQKNGPGPLPYTTYAKELNLDGRHQCLT
jgi:hypothetical protein